MVLGSLFHLGWCIYTETSAGKGLLWVLPVVALNFLIIVLVFSMIFFKQVLEIIGCFLMLTFMDQCENFIVNALFYWEPM